MISLRSYQNEVNHYIETQKTDLAITHCTHILKYYPKTLDVYRLLAKAFLDKKLFRECEDILKRILAAVPNDFFSLLALSIIQEDRKDLVSSISFMEMAFDSQPSSQIVQEELKRLESYRDGKIPEKIRITKPALAQMYLNGDLIKQGVAEAEKALESNPGRFDIHCLVLKAYCMAGYIDKAVILSHDLITKLPYCFLANQILSSAVPRESDNPSNYHDRVLEMDPYFEKFNLLDSATTHLPNEAVMLEKLNSLDDMTLNMDDSEISKWKESAIPLDFQIPMDTPPTEAPAWIPVISNNPVSNISEIPNPEIKRTPKSNEYWIDDIQEMDNNIESMDATDTKNDLPDWLKEFSTNGPNSQIDDPLFAADDQALGDFQGEKIPTDLGEQSQGSMEDLQGIPDWLKSEEVRKHLGDDLGNNTNIKTETIPDWLEEIKAIEGADNQEDLSISQFDVPSLDNLINTQDATNTLDTSVPKDLQEFLSSSDDKDSQFENIFSPLDKILEDTQPVRVIKSANHDQEEGTISQWLKTLEDEEKFESTEYPELTINSSDLEEVQQITDEFTNSREIENGNNYGLAGATTDTLDANNSELADVSTDTFDSDNSVPARTSIDTRDGNNSEPGGATSDTIDEQFRLAYDLIRAGSIEEAASIYKNLLATKSIAKLIISHLEEIVDQNNNDPTLYQILGDAYFQDKNMVSALDAYTKVNKQDDYLSGGMLERTLVIIKPDAVQRGLIGEILGRLEKRGLKLIAAKFLIVSGDLASSHYAIHAGKPFYNGLIKYITSSPVVAMVWEGPHAISSVRKTMGSTNPDEAEPGSIRHDYSLEIGRNLTHASDSEESAEKEIDLWFNNSEIYQWDRSTDPWLFGKN